MNKAFLVTVLFFTSLFSCFSSFTSAAPTLSLPRHIYLEVDNFLGELAHSSVDGPNIPSDIVGLTAGEINTETMIQKVEFLGRANTYKFTGTFSLILPVLGQEDGWYQIVVQTLRRNKIWYALNGARYDLTEAIFVPMPFHIQIKMRECWNVLLKK